MSEKDYEQLKGFHREVLEAAQITQQYNQQLEEALGEVKQEIIRHAFCQGRRT